MKGEPFTAAQIVLHMSVDGDAVTLVHMWRLKQISEDGGFSEWYVQDDPVLILTEDILDTVISTRLRGGVCGVLLPCEYR